MGFLFRLESLTTQDRLFCPEPFLVISSAFAAFVRFSPEVLEEENRVFREAHAENSGSQIIAPQVNKHIFFVKGMMPKFPVSEGIASRGSGLSLSLKIKERHLTKYVRIW